MILNIKYFGMVVEAVGKMDEEFVFSKRSINELDSLLKKKGSRVV